MSHLYADRPTTVYRIYNENGQLLYVGIATTYLRRLSHHETSAEWFEQGATIRLTHYPTRGLAATAEVAATVAEKPLYNIAWNQGKKVVTVDGADVTEYSAELTRQYHAEKIAKKVELDELDKAVSKLVSKS